MIKLENYQLNCDLWWRCEAGQDSIQSIYDDQVESGVPDRSMIDRFETINRASWLNPVTLEAFTPEKGMRAWSVVQRFLDEGMTLDALKSYKHLASNFESCIHKFCVNLYVHSKYIGGAPYRYLAERSCKEGPSFAKAWDEERDQLIDSIFMRTDKDDSVCVAKIYRPNDLFPWQPLVYDIKEVVNIPVDIDDNYLQRFAQAIDRWLDQRIFDGFKAMPYYMYHSDSSKSSMDGPQFTLQACKPSKVRGPTKLVDIPRALKEARAAILEEYSSLVKIRWINASVHKLLLMDNRYFGRYDGTTGIFRTRKALLGTYRQRQQGLISRPCYMRDFKKEGLTKPRVLLRVMLACLHKRFPEEEVFSDIFFFDNWTVQDRSVNGVPGEILHPLRGHGLGMANDLTTLMQIGIELMNPVRPFYSAYFNDDALVICDSVKDLKRYILEDQKICQGLSLIVKDKSLRMMQGSCVICEQYCSSVFRNLGDKTPYRILALGQVLTACNVAHARALYSNMSTKDVPEQLLQEISDYWGPVLYTGEQDTATPFGGWGQEFDLSKYEGTEFLPKQAAGAFWAYSSIRFRVNEWRKKKPTQFLPKLRKYLDEEFLDEIDYPKTITADDRFRAERRNYEYRRAWNTYLKRLRMRYNWDIATSERWHFTYDDAYKMLVEQYPRRDITPPKNLRFEVKVDYDLYTQEDRQFTDPYSAQNLVTAQGCYKIGAGAYPSKLGRAETMTLASLAYPAAAALALRKSKTFMPAWWNAYIKPPDLMVQFWHNPFANHLYVKRGLDSYAIIPKIIGDSKKELLLERAKYFGRELSIDEWLAFSSLRPCDTAMIATFAHKIGNKKFDFLLETLKKYPGWGLFYEERGCSGEDLLIALEAWIARNEETKAAKEIIIADVDFAPGRHDSEEKEIEEESDDEPPLDPESVKQLQAILSGLPPPNYVERKEELVNAPQEFTDAELQALDHLKGNLSEVTLEELDPPKYDVSILDDIDPSIPIVESSDDDDDYCPWDESSDEEFVLNETQETDESFNARLADFLADNWGTTLEDDNDL